MLGLGTPDGPRKLIFLLLEVFGQIVEARQSMLEVADERFRVEGVVGRGGTRLARGGYGGVRQLFDKVLDYKVFALATLGVHLGAAQTHVQDVQRRCLE